MAVINGNGRSNTLSGTGDDDLIRGRGGDDLISGGDGNDTLSGDAGNDTIVGGAGRDVIRGGTGDDSLDGGTGRNDNDQVSGDAGDDTLVGYGENDILRGDDGNDTFIARPGSTTDGNISVNGGESDTGDTIDLREVLSQGFEIDALTRNPSSTDNGIPSFTGQIRLVNSADGRSLNINYDDIEAITPCFTPGTLIATPQGERRVEDLHEGDRVITRDSGVQRLVWIGEKCLHRSDLKLHPELQPVLVRAGSLGRGLPERDLLVSPNHRILVANDRTALYFEDREVLVAAKHLTDHDGVDRVEAAGVSYIHFMFEHHEVVLSEGVWSESFQPGSASLKGIGDAQRTEILSLFPDLGTREGIEGFQSARRTLKRHEARLLSK
ncbi:Hemolysin-type calcium-binding repeat-containing protein [Palleronia pelagia]|uniref:Hemolysin-type calcium-binding repeat-containing protein n=2 Tax=Palleronia pelagia TaxID=387096 RepID=A0A1H8BQZ7_9RHOB|nr:Hemolysin-type calcium-binding repeat-containing protein [Palleronia pelagia]